ATATDADGNTSEFAADVTAAFFTASAGGPYAIAEGASVSLAGSATSPLGYPLTYTWTVNGHAGAASGTGPAFTWAQLQALGMDDGTRSFPVSLTVDDGHGHTVTSPVVSLTVSNTPPTASLSGPVGGVTFQPLAFTLAATDPSSTDQAAGLTYVVLWGDSG